MVIAVLLLAFAVAVVGAALLLLLRPSPGPAVPPRQGVATIGQRPPSQRTPTPVSAARLVAVEGPEAGRTFAINAASFTIGRHTDNALQLKGHLLSRHHAVVVFESGKYVLYDRDSTNGTYVNGRRIAQHELQSGDLVQIGPVVLEFHLPAVGRPVGRTAVDGGGKAVPPVVDPSAMSASGRAQPPPTAPDPLADYELSLIRRTGTAEVYRAVHRASRETVAIKVMLSPDPYLRDKFEDSSKILMSLQHPHIAQVHAFGRIERQDSLYMVMEFCSRGSLRDRLVKGRPAAPDFVRQVVEQSCSALDFVHGHGIIHRDIKPENILFGGDGQVRLVDFGVARFTSHVTHTVDGMIVGTPFYLSYEQAKGMRVDVRSDVYSLGVVLYEMCTGRVPFEGDALDVVQRHIQAAPPSPRALNPQVSSALETAILRALEKDRERRYQTVGELAAAVCAQVGGAAAVGRPDGRRAPGEPAPAVPSGAPGAGRRMAGVPAPTAAAVRGGQRDHPAGSLTLVQTAGVGAGRRLVLGEGVTVLGRQSFDPRDATVSREHARFVVHGGTAWVENLSASSGTYCNGRPVFGRVVLAGGDELQLGGVKVRVTLA